MMSRKKNAHPPAHRLGATTVEFAVTLPFALLFLFSLVEIVSLHKLRDGVQMAVFSGAREAIIDTAQTRDVRSEITTVLNSYGIRTADIAILPSQLDSTTDDIQISISVEANAENGVILGRLYNGKIERTVNVSRR